MDTQETHQLTLYLPNRKFPINIYRSSVPGLWHRSLTVVDESELSPENMCSVCRGGGGYEYAAAYNWSKTHTTLTLNL